MDTPITAPAIPRRWRAFLVPRRLIYDNHLKFLSHSGLKLYVWLAHKSYRKLDADVTLSDWEIVKLLALPMGELVQARDELKLLGLIDYRIEGKCYAIYSISRDVSPWESKTAIETPRP